MSCCETHQTIWPAAPHPPRATSLVTELLDVGSREEEHNQRPDGDRQPPRSIRVYIVATKNTEESNGTTALHFFFFYLLASSRNRTAVTHTHGGARLDVVVRAGVLTGLTGWQYHACRPTHLRAGGTFEQARKTVLVVVVVVDAEPLQGSIHSCSRCPREKRDNQSPGVEQELPRNAERLKRITARFSFSALRSKS